MNTTKAKGRTGPGIPQCINNGQTVAMIGTTLSVAVAIGAMIFASTSAIRTDLRAEIQRVDANVKDMRTELRADIEGVRKELTADIEGVRKELTADIEGVRAAIKALDGRLRVVEQTVVAVNARVTGAVTHAPGVDAPTSSGTQPAG